MTLTREIPRDHLFRVISFLHITEHHLPNDEEIMAGTGLDHEQFDHAMSALRLDGLVTCSPYKGSEANRQYVLGSESMPVRMFHLTRLRADNYVTHSKARVFDRFDFKSAARKMRHILEDSPYCAKVDIGHREDYCWLSIAELAVASGWTESTVSRCLDIGMYSPTDGLIEKPFPAQKGRDPFIWDKVKYAHRSHQQMHNAEPVVNTQGAA